MRGGRGTARGSACRRPTMQTALVACPYSGRGWARSSARPSTCASAASGGYQRGTARTAGTARGPRAPASSRSPRSRARELPALRRDAIQVEERDRVVAGVVLGADEPRVASIVEPLGGQQPAHPRSFAIWAKARAFGPPRPPPHAPQSWADSCGLLRLMTVADDEHERERRSRIPVSRARAADVGHLPTVKPSAFRSAAPCRSDRARGGFCDGAIGRLPHAAPP